MNDSTIRTIDLDGGNGGIHVIDEVESILSMKGDSSEVAGGFQQQQSRVYQDSLAG